MFKKITITLILFIAVKLCVAQNQIPDLVFYEYESDSGVAITNQGKNLVLIFTSENCPYVDAYNRRINQLIKTNKDFNFIIVNVGKKDSKNNYQCKVISDPLKKIANACAVTRTPEVILLKGLTVIYKGAIDDNPLAEHDVRNHFLQKAINDYKKGVNSTKFHKAYGCNIQR